MTYATIARILMIGLFAGAFLLPGLSTVGPPDNFTEPDQGSSTIAQSLSLPGHYTAEQLESARKAMDQKRAKLAAHGPKRFDQPREAMEFYLDQRLAPGMTELPIEHMRTQLNSIKAREAALQTRYDLVQPGAPAPIGTGGIGSWNSIGPGNIGGRTRAIVIDPVTPDTMYAAGVAGGVWKSYDAGATWNPTDDLMLNLAVCALAIDPNNPNVLYAGTGEGYVNDVFVRGLGIFKTTDAGATWNQLSGTVDGVPSGSFHYVNDIIISPNDSNRIYAATRFGVWRSLDAGQNWSIVLRNPWFISGTPATNGCTVGCTDLDVRTDSNPDVLFAAFGSHEADGLYRTDDGGATWIQYTTGTYQGRMTIAIAPSNNDVIYLAMADNGGLNGWGRLVSVFRADDGVTFNSVLDFDHPFSPWLFSYVSIATGCYDHPVIYSQGWYDNIIAVDPLDPHTVWVGGINLFRSDNSGQTFGITNYWFFYLDDPPPPTYMHPDQHEITFHPDFNGTTNQIMYVGNDGGIFRTTNARAASSQEECPIGPDPGPPPEIIWENMNNNYAVTQFYHGDSSVAGAERYVGGAQDNGSSMGLSSVTPNSWDMIYGGDGGYVAIDPRDSERFFIEIQGFPTIAVTTDGGETFTDAITGITDTDGIFINPYAMDQSNPDIMWTGGSRPWRTTNGAASWELAGANFPNANNISAIAIAPSDSNVIYAGFNNGYVARTTNGLDPSPTWTVFSNGLYGGWVSSVAVDPADTDVAYCTYTTFNIPHILKTSDGGQNWTSIDGIDATGVPDIPVHWIAVRPTDSQQLYAATEFGIFASDNGGTTWNPVNTGLAHTVVESLDFKDADTLVAFTHGRGTYVAHLDADGTVAAGLACDPATGTLPFSVGMTATLDNLYLGQTRRIAARINVTTAGGSQYSNWRSGWSNVAAGDSTVQSWSQNIPALGQLVGDNVFTLVVEDVTPPPYNQPPHPPAGDTSTDSCTVTGLAP